MLVAALIAALLPLGSGRAVAGEVVNLWQLPVEAQHTIVDQVRDGTVEEIDREDDGRQITYVVDYTTREGDGYELTVSEDGTILSHVES